MGVFEIRRMYVDLHQRGVDKWAETHFRSRGAPEATFVVHYAMHEIGSVQELSTTTSGFPKAEVPCKKKWAGNWNVMVLGADTVKSNIG